MKTLTFNTNSWHFLIASKIAGYRPYTEWGDARDCANICSYSKHVMAGLALLVIAAAVIAIFGFLLWSIIFGIYFSLLAGAWVFNDWAVATMLISLVFGLVAGSFKFFNWYGQRKLSTEYRNRPDSFVKHAYKSWKEKYCVRVEFTDKQHDDNLRADRVDGE